MDVIFTKSENLNLPLQKSGAENLCVAKITKWWMIFFPARAIIGIFKLEIANSFVDKGAGQNAINFVLIHNNRAGSV